MALKPEQRVAIIKGALDNYESQLLLAELDLVVNTGNADAIKEVGQRIAKLKAGIPLVRKAYAAELAEPVALPMPLGPA